MKSPLLPAPSPSVTDAGYWEACRRQELAILHCRACGHWHHPPLPLCPGCQSAELEWRAVIGPAVLFSWTRVHLAVHPSVADFLPYCIAVVEFPQCGNVRLIAWLDHQAASSPPIGEECELFWLVTDDGTPVPAFRIKSRKP